MLSSLPSTWLPQFCVAKYTQSSQLLTGLRLWFSIGEEALYFLHVCINHESFQAVIKAINDSISIFLIGIHDAMRNSFIILQSLRIELHKQLHLHHILFILSSRKIS